MINRLKPYLDEESAADAQSTSAAMRRLQSAVVAPLRDQIVKRPREALALSLIAGVALGWLVKRR